MSPSPHDSTPPAPDSPTPGSVREISVRELAEMLGSPDPPTVFDVREEWEHEIARIPGARLLDERTARELLDSGDRARPLILACHHGVRSLGAARWFASRGFRDAVSVRGGVDAWSLEIDSGVPRY